MDDLLRDPLLAKTTEVKGYKILPPCVLYSRIGAGGMGAVYRGHHLNLDIEVAIKCLKPSLVDDDPTFVERFKREGRSAASINHQNVIRVFDVAENLGLHYLIMEYVAGETARQRVERKGPLQIAEALQIAYEASLGLGEAHRIGIIHRDIKPDNLLISTRGQVKVADLGLAKPAVGSGTSALSMAGQVMGTPPYMPPEQWGEGTVTAASDVWAMGALLYYLLAGKEAIRGESLANIMSKIVLQDFPDIREVRSDVPELVVALLQKATAKDPGQRFLTGYELSNAIANLPEHRISLGDTKAGTTELRTMLSPPPMPQLEEIKQVLREERDTTRNQLGPKRPADADGKAGGVGAWRARAPLIALLTVVVGGGSAAFAFRDSLFGSKPTDKRTANNKPDPQPVQITDPLAKANQLESQGQFVVALRAARAASAQGGAVLDDERITRLRTGASQQLESDLTRIAPNAPVVKDSAVTFEGRFSTITINEVLLDKVAVAANNGRFRATRTPPESGLVQTQVRVTEQDVIDLEPWQVRFVAEPVLPIAFVGKLLTDPPLGAQGFTSSESVVVTGRTNDRDVGLSLDGKLLDKVQWQEDGTFRVDIPLSNEGRNTVRLTAQRAGDRQSADSEIEVIRLTKPPPLTLLAPRSPTYATLATEVAIGIQTDEWTDAVRGTFGRSQFALVKDGARDSIKWRTTAALQLRDGINRVRLEAVNLAGLTRPLELTITCTAPRLEITGVTLTVGGAKRAVEPGATVYVNRQPELLAAANDKDAQLLIDGRKEQARFVPALTAGRPQKPELVLRKGARKSEPWTCTLVLDTKKPSISAREATPVAPGEAVTLSGSWRDDFGIQAVRCSSGEAVQLTRKANTNGSWTVNVKAATTASQRTLTAIDLAGNEAQTVVQIPIIATRPAPDVAKPVAVKPAAQLSPKIDTRLFDPVGKRNQLGFPEGLRHKATGIEMVAVGLRDNAQPSLYVAKRVVTELQWAGTGSDEPKTSVTWGTVNTKVQSSRFEGLNLLTKEQWALALSTAAAIRKNEKGEWLARARGESITQRSYVYGDEVKTTLYTNSNAYIGFRVGFAPK